MNEDKVRFAIGQWRDSLVNLTGRNRLINYRPTRSSTIEFTRLTAEDVYEMISSKELTFTMGTRPADKPKDDEADDGQITTEDLENAVLSQIHEFDFDSYPDHLFADKTQRDVDKALRNLAGIAKREFIDKGLRTLYLALGELRWKEDSGDARRSPLLLVPAELDSLGPRERMYVEFSDDDIAVNPALALRLAEDHGVTLPSTEEVLTALDSNGVSEALSLFQKVEFPEGWEVVDFAALGAFMFAKEAMYRDLLDNEAQIVDAALIQTLSGAVHAEASEFTFEPYGDDSIDDVAPPESTPLVLDADASQRAAVQAAVEGRSFTLDGPPGTGKSQTIANIVGGLIEAGKSILFVSEKAVALDVVRDRLTERGLEPFLFELHSSKAARKEVALKLGASLNSRPVPPTGMTAVRIEQLRETRTKLSEYVMAANEVREPLGASVHLVLGWYEQVRSDHTGPAFEGSVPDLSAAALAEVESLVPRVERTWQLHLQGSKATWFDLSLDHEGDLRFLLERLDSLLDDLAPILLETRGVRTAFRLDRISELAEVGALLTQWHSEPSYHDDPWLDSDDFAGLVSAVDSYEHAVAELEEAGRAAQEFGGARWQELPIQLPEQSMSIDVDLLSLPGMSPNATGADLQTVQEGVAQARETIRTLLESSVALADLIGADAPRSTTELQQLVDAGRVLLSADSPPVEWIYDERARLVANEHRASTQNAEEALSSAESQSRGVFTDAVLSADVADIENLAASTQGFFKRFTRDHRAMRAALAAISTQKWKIARDALPSARAWADAHRHYTETAANALGHLGPHFLPGGGTDWERLAQSLESAQIASMARFRVRSATERLQLDEHARSTSRDLLVELERDFVRWTTDHDQWGRRVGAEDSDLAALEERLTGRSARLGQIALLVAAQREVLGSSATVEAHIQAATARSDFAKAERAANECRSELATRARNDPERFGLDVHSATEVRHKIQWARGIFNTAREQTEYGFTAEQLRALRESHSIAARVPIVVRYIEAAKELIEAFGGQRRDEMRDDLDDDRSAPELVSSLRASVEDIDTWFELQRTLLEAKRVGLGPAIEYAGSRGIDVADIGNILRSTVYRAWLDLQLAEDERLKGADGATRDELVATFRQLDSELAGAAVARVIEAGASRRPKSSAGQAAVIRREAEKKRRHIPVRDLVAEARDVILALHPCFMMSPLAVSQYLPAERIFDVVIFDEASQVLPADAINCIYRASAVITAGDQKQLPPTSFFQASVDELDDDDEEDLANDYESILDLMKSSGSFTAQSLRWHYRSRHEHLIAYSNSSFYDSRLITFPGAVDDSVDAGVNFYKVPGVYRRSAGRDNPIEAQHVAQRVVHHFSTRPGLSLGVVAFSTAQRDAIETAVELARAERPDLDGFFTDDRSQGFFVKSLESVQGDERDVMIFSIGYGPDEQGKIYRNFGPVSRNGGERRLNVAITRAKQLVEVVSSMSASDIGEVNSAGGRHLRRYLDFAERGPSALAMELGPEGLDTESPFEDAVVGFVRSLGFEVQPQVGVAGYRIDLGVKHPTQAGAFMLGIECDGAMYHSSRAARDRDRIRHQILEGLGWTIHHIWGTAWYRHTKREQERLRELLERLAAQPVTGRTGRPASPAIREEIFDVVEHDFKSDPEWVHDYQVARLDRIPAHIDLSDVGNGRWLRHFVESVALVEAPVHIDVMAQRLREHSSYDRIGARIRQTLLRAVQHAEVEFDGEYVRTYDARAALVRRSTSDFSRPVGLVAEEEVREAVARFVEDAVGITRPELVSRVAGVFGWRRTGSDIRSRIEASVDGLIADAVIVDGGGGLKLGTPTK